MASRSEGHLRGFCLAGTAHPVFDGGGARRWGSRWCTPGRSIIHMASTFALAVLENLVHWNRVGLPPAMQYVVVVIPDAVDRTVLEPDRLPGWDRADYRVSQACGDAWYDGGDTAVLVVPSVLSPFEPNILINQHHPDTRKIAVSEERPVVLDPRLAPSSR